MHGTGRSTGRCCVAAAKDTQAGFALLEVMLAMSLLAVIVAASSSALVAGMNAAARLQHEQVAAQVATRAMETVQAVDAQLDANGCTKILQGRTQTAVTAQWATAPAGLDLSAADPAWAGSGCSAGALVLPLQGIAGAFGSAPEDPVVRNGASYTVRTFVGSCVVTPGVGCVATHQAPQGSLNAAYLAVVAVTWADRTCPPQGCLSSVATIIDPKVERVFNVRSAAAPVANPDTVCVVANTPTAVDVTANDTGSLGSSPVSVVTQPSHGSLAPIGSGTGGYTPAPGYLGTDAFSYRLADVNGTLSSTVTVTVTVASTC